jgi:hypothetical protein
MKHAMIPHRVFSIISSLVFTILFSLLLLLPVPSIQYESSKFLLFFTSLCQNIIMEMLTFSLSFPCLFSLSFLSSPLLRLLCSSSPPLPFSACPVQQASEGYKIGT